MAPPSQAGPAVRGGHVRASEELKTQVGSVGGTLVPERTVTRLTNCHPASQAPWGPPTPPRAVVGLISLFLLLGAPP